jgi:hypothetical protein
MENVINNMYRDRRRYKNTYATVHMLYGNRSTETGRKPIKQEINE